VAESNQLCNTVLWWTWDQVETKETTNHSLSSGRGHGWVEELKSSSSHLGCKTLCCFICPMVKRFKMFKGKVFGDLMTHFHKVEFLNIVCDEFPSHRLFYFYMCGWSWSMWFWYSVLSLDFNTSTKD